MTIFAKKLSTDSTNRSFSTTDFISSDETEQESQNLNSDYSFSEPGNIIPHFWFGKIIDEKGKPDLTAITLLSEIFALYRFSISSSPCSYLGSNACNETSLIDKSLRISYEHFTKKFFISKEKARRGLVRLEELGILKREVCNISVAGGGRCNKLMITLDQNFFLSCFRNPEQDLRAQRDSLINKKPKDKDTPEDKGDNSADNCNEDKTQSMQISYHHISNKNKINKDRSIKSNFLQNSFFKKEEDYFKIQTNFIHSPIQTKKPILQLKDFYPISEADSRRLQIQSGRAFTLNAMNEILLDMSKRLQDRWFKSKKAFLSYMSKAFAYEMRDAVKINNENFRIRANQTEEESIVRKQEEFLSEIEYSLQVSPEWHLKKKLCAVLERGKAYNLLSSYKHYRIEGDTCEIYLTKHVDLTRIDRDIILNQVKASHEYINLATGKNLIITNLEIIMLSSTPQTKTSKMAEQRIEFPDSIWGSISQALVSYYGEALYKSWFSKLTPEVDEQQKIIKLKAPTEFIKDWICRNYSQILEKVTAKYEFNYEIVR